MPATEQTWYDQKLLHVVFGFSGLAMLVSTVWMFAADHNREWKGFQRNYRDAEQRLTDWRIAEEQSAEQLATAAELGQKLFSVRTQPPDKILVANFKHEVLKDEYARGQLTKQEFDAEVEILRKWFDAPADQQVAEGRFASLAGDYARLHALAQDANTKRQEFTAAQEAVTQAQEQLTAVSQQADDLAPDATREERQALTKQVAASKKSLQAAEKAALIKADTATDAEKNAVILQDSMVNVLSGMLSKSKFREEQLLSQRKFKSADVDAAKARLDLAVRDNKPPAELDRLQAVVDELVDADGDGLKALTHKRQDATAHRESLQGILKQITEQPEQIKAQIEEHQAEIARLEGSQKERRSTFFVSTPPFLGKRWLELPILDAFSSPLKIDNLWTDGLEISNGSFGKVRRFDRCTTCHKGIDKTAPGSAVKPAYLPAQELVVSLRTPDSKPAPKVDDDGNPLPLTLTDVYGFGLASYGLISANDVTINKIAASSLAANAKVTVDAHGRSVPSIGLRVGDVIQYVNSDKVLSPEEARQFLIDGTEWGQPVNLVVRRGLPQPYPSHPRLDLFVGSLSPHSLARMGCTSCHEGQGSATSFKYSSHAPDSLDQEHDWIRDHDWFHNHHWILPMYPNRLVEASCLKCHHEVAELEPSRRFPDPPAPKLVEGWQLIGKFGCYGCHEINGYDGPDRRVGPDLRLEPNYFAAAAEVTADPHFDQLDSALQEATRTLIQQPFRNGLRQSLREFLLADAAAEAPILSPYSHKMAEVLQDQETPGTRRKAGPTLRYVASKLGAPFIYDWIRKPKDFRPPTKMPQYFGLWDHLDGEGLELAQRMEPVEIRGMVEYLLERSQDFQYLQPATGVEPADADRGKLAFEIRGCLACHQHDDFPDVTADQGPNLTGLGDKFSAAGGAPNGQAWLYSWIKQPTHYNPRTKMPYLYLDPVKAADGKVTDPVADIAAYLMSSSKGWRPSAEAVTGLTPNVEYLDALALEHLEDSFPRRRAETYLADGIPEHVAKTLKGAEVELTGSADIHNKLMYVGRKAIVKYGCHGCHNIPGFEAAKPIGTTLADWGRKESSKLAFEHILEYLHNGGHGGGDHSGPTEHGAASSPTDQAHEGHSQMAHVAHDDFDDSYYMGQLEVADRSGFFWQKLKEPRSYDYQKVANKKYNERLRMPLFPINGKEREAIATFILGLVAEPPAEEFVYHPDPKEQAIVQGRRVLEKFNCGGCHILDAATWELAFQPGELGNPPDVDDFPFLASHFTPDEIAASQEIDHRRGVVSAVVRGLPAINNNTAEPMVLDEEEDEIDPDEEYDPDTLIYPVDLWEPFVLDGQPFEVGVKRLNIPGSAIRRHWPATGGDLTRRLLPRVLEEEKKVNPAANGNEAWSWLPPPLIGEGRKVRPEWLHSFLLEPYTIRPAVFLRMPKFNMSPDEASQLVNYFAAHDDADYPFNYDDRMMASHLEKQNEAFAAAHGGDRLEQAMNIVTHKDYCVQCHYVGDFEPTNNVRALAPELSTVQFRLQPEYLRKWLANPKSVLPYTAMPQNVLYDPHSETLGGVPQDVYPGTSVDQIDALVDLLMNYSEYSGSQHSVKSLVKAAPAPDAQAPANEQGENQNEEAAQSEAAEPEKKAVSAR